MFQMLAQINPTYGGFVLIAWTGIFLGILHSLMPCEDKAIFCFYAFGVARDWKQAFRIVNFYGMGLMLMNLAIGTLFAYLGRLFGQYLLSDIGTVVINTAASLSLILSGLIMIYQIKKKTYLPHSSQLQDLTEGLGYLRKRKRTAFVLGLLAGIPPCIFEIAVYSYGTIFSAKYGWGNGVWVFFFFGIGTWLGLIPLALLGSMSGRLSKWIKRSSFSRIRDRITSVGKEKLRKKSSSESSKKGKKTGLEKTKAPLQENEIEGGDQLEAHGDQGSGKSGYSKIEISSAIILIVLGVVFLILAILRVDVFLVQDVPEVPTLF